MNKPISIANYEFNSNLRDLINMSGLPPCVVVYAMKEILAEVEVAGRRQLETDIEAYKQAAGAEGRDCIDGEQTLQDQA